MSRRRKSRQYALQLLFRLEVTKDPVDWAALADFWEDKKNLNEDVVAFTKELVSGTWSHRDEIDGEIVKAAANWSLDRMATVDRSLLRLAVYEILFRPDIPVSVSINEALEIAKQFSTAESAAFINGLLDRIARNSGKLEKA